MSLTEKTKQAVKWSAIGSLSRYIIQLGSQVVLARLIGAESYGLFAMGLIVMTFSNFLADVGLAWGLVQNQKISNDDIRFTFTWQILFGLFTTALVFLLAPTLATLFDEPRLEAIVCGMSIACVINASSATATNLLRRQLDFRAINIAQLTSYVMAYVGLGIPMAFAGQGVWALVAAWLSQALINLLMVTIRCPHPIKPLFWCPAASHLSGVGVTVFFTNLINWALNNVDRIFLGRVLNAQTLGLYTVGYNLSSIANTFFLGALQPAFLSAGARLQSDLSKLRNVYLSILSLLWILVAPFFVILSIVSDDLVITLYGESWKESGVVLGILALAMPAYMTWGMSTPILWNTGRKHLESLIQIPILILAGIAFGIWINFGLKVAAMITATILLLRSILIFGFACRALQIPSHDWIYLMLRGVVMCCIVGLFSQLGRMLAVSWSDSSVMSLSVALLMGITSHIAVCVKLQSLLGSVTVDAILRFSPSFISPFISRWYPRVARQAA